VRRDDVPFAKRPRDLIGREDVRRGQRCGVRGRCVARGHRVRPRRDGTPNTASCEAILGLHDRTLSDGGSDALVASDVVDASACDGEFCACHPHAFCDDFDFYNVPADLQTRWQIPGVTNTVLALGGSLAIDNSTTVLPPTPPNALLSTVLLPTELQGAGVVAGQVDANIPNPTGIIVTVQMRVVSLDPADGATPILDSGVMLFGAVLAALNFTTKNGVGVALSEQGAYVGYALDVLSTNARLAQGKQFINFDPASVPAYAQLQLIVARRSSKAVSNATD
jgi:hypothetical protein